MDGKFRLTDINDGTYDVFKLRIRVTNKQRALFPVNGET